MFNFSIRSTCRRVTLITLLSSVGISANTALATDFVCPASTRITAPAPAESQEGWAVSYRQGPVRLTGASAFDGPPSDLAALAPAEEGAVKAGRSRVVWKFDGSFDKGRWISCDYGDGLVSLSRKLEQSVTQCAAQLERTTKPVGLSIRFSCY